MCILCLDNFSLQNILKLQNLVLCRQIKKIPLGLSELLSLTIENNTFIDELPNDMTKLQLLFLKNVQHLKTIPEFPNLVHLSVDNCSSLISIGSANSSSSTQTYEFPNLINCLITNARFLKNLPNFGTNLFNLTLINCSLLSSLPSSSSNVRNLHVHQCSSLIKIPEEYTKLEVIGANECSSLQCIPSNCPFLKTLYAKNADNLVISETSYPELTCYKK